MGDVSRESSARTSRRRRWEVNSKESFETSLAFEESSPYIGPPKEPHVGKEGESEERPETAKAKRPKTARKNSAQKRQNPKIQSFKCDKPKKVDSPPSDPLSEKLSALMKNIDVPLDPPDTPPTSEKLMEDSPIKATAPPLDSSPDKQKLRKKPRCKSVSPADPSCSEITKQLNKLSEDVVQLQRPSQFIVPISGVLLDPLSSVSNNMNTSGGNVSTIYCEKLNNFVVAKDSTLGIPLGGAPDEDSAKMGTRAGQALLIQTGFRTFSVLLQGLLAGITIAHCLVVLLFGEEVAVKGAFMQTFFALIIFLSAICLVSAFDRCDLAGQGIFTGSGIQFPWTPLFYLVSLTLSLVMIRAEDFFSNYQHFSTNQEEEKTTLFQWWRSLCIARTCFAVLGWAVVIANPHVDVLRSRIIRLT